MGEIYSQAEVVIIWLGSDAQDVETMLWAQDILWQKCEEGMGELFEVNVQLLQALDMDLKGWLDAWKSVENFFRRRRWYRRAWVFQEAALARQLEIRNGPTYLDWPRLSLIVRNGLQSGFGIPSVLHCVIISTYPQELQQGKGRIWQDETGPIRTSLQYWYYTLLGLVTSLRSFQASCEHDKVYAALGLTMHHAPVHTPEFVVPEYAAPWEDAFVGFAKMLLRQIPCLIALSWVEGHDHSSSLPTWCPDYRFPGISPMVTAAVSDHPFSQLFSASGHTGPNEVISYFDKEKLLVNGKKVDMITQQTENLVQVFDYTHPSSIKSCLEICLKLPPIYPFTQQDRLEVLWRTMILDQYYEVYKQQYHPAPPEISQNFVGWVRSSLAVGTLFRGEAYNEHREVLKNIESWNQAFESSPLRLPKSEEVIDLKRKMSMKSLLEGDWLSKEGPMDNKFHLEIGGAARWAVGRCLFRTSQHELLGLGPEKLKEGDEVWLIKGALVPFVLRPQVRVTGKLKTHIPDGS